MEIGDVQIAHLVEPLEDPIARADDQELEPEPQPQAADGTPLPV